MSSEMGKYTAFRQGTFLSWMTSFQTGGSAGDLQITDNKITWKTAAMNFRGKFEYDLDQIVSVKKSKYLNFIIIPSRCFEINFKDGKSYKFTFSFTGGKSGIDEEVRSLFVSRGIKVGF